jgi:glycosyltransferase involved in cell wall biosynthesis
VAAAISAVVMTLNEERNIEYCLRSVRTWCDEIVVLDMFSDDATPEIARRYADVFLTHERIESFDAGRKKAFDSASGDWIFSLDADEVATPELAEWITSFVESDPDYDVALIPRANVFLGRWIRSSGWWPGKSRLFRRGAIEVSAKLHRGLVPREGARIARLPRSPKLALWHFTRLSVATMVDKTNRYTTIEARQALAEGRAKVSAFQLIYQPLATFAVFLRRRGYRDGMAGLAWVVDRAYYRWLSLVKRWDESEVDKRPAEYDRQREEIVSRFAPAGPPITGQPPAATDLVDIGANGRDVGERLDVAAREDG